MDKVKHHLPGSRPANRPSLSRDRVPHERYIPHGRFSAVSSTGAAGFRRKQQVLQWRLEHLGIAK